MYIQLPSWLTVVQPNIVRFFGFFQSSKILYTCLEYVDGGDLTSFLRNCNREAIGICELVRLACFAAAGMKYLASHNIVHRDIAGDYVHLQPSDAIHSEKHAGLPHSAGSHDCMQTAVNKLIIIQKITDFEMSRLLSDDYYISHVNRAPWQWTSPESLKSRKWTFASDIWFISSDSHSDSLV